MKRGEPPSWQRSEPTLAGNRSSAWSRQRAGLIHARFLVQWAKVEAIDVRTERVPFDKLFTFRGDTDDSWQLAEKFISEEIIAAHAP
jgi:hypothetical protein